jgi:HAD superfamily hydrolase (TIGR01458 family)
MDKGFIIDLEGTLVNNGVPLPNSVEFINYLNEHGIKYCVITNTVSKSIEKWERILDEAGLHIKKENILYPIIVLNDFLKEGNIETHYFIGPDDIRKAIPKTIDYTIPEYIIFCDFERIELNYTIFNEIFQYIKNGSKMITTSYSNYYISKNEYKMDTGIFVKMYETLSGEKAKIIGKPSPMVYKTALKQLGLENDRVIAIGDDGLTDIIGGKDMGIETILVKTGKYKNGDEEIYKPNKVVNNLDEIIKLVK